MRPLLEQGYAELQTIRTDLLGAYNRVLLGGKKEYATDMRSHRVNLKSIMLSRADPEDTNYASIYMKVF